MWVIVTGIYLRYYYLLSVDLISANRLSADDLSNAVIFFFRGYSEVGNLDLSIYVFWIFSMIRALETGHKLWKGPMDDYIYVKV